MYVLNAFDTQNRENENKNKLWIQNSNVAYVCVELGFYTIGFPCRMLSFHFHSTTIRKRK